MPELVTDCPRCNAQNITFDLLDYYVTCVAYGWQNHYEAFCRCRHCHQGTIFELREFDIGASEYLKKTNLGSIKTAVNSLFQIDGFVNTSHVASVDTPEYLPKNIADIFEEATACLAIECFNAAGAMFRLCIDLCTKGLLPEGDCSGLSQSVRERLAARLNWLFETSRLPADLKGLATCVRQDGNDAAHDGTLKKDDADDLCDFTAILLERIYTEPMRLELANKRRISRRKET